MICLGNQVYFFASLKNEYKNEIDFKRCYKTVTDRRVNSIARVTLTQNDINKYDVRYPIIFFCFFFFNIFLSFFTIYSAIGNGLGIKQMI